MLVLGAVVACSEPASSPPTPAPQQVPAAAEKPAAVPAPAAATDPGEPESAPQPQTATKLAPVALPIDAR